MASYDAFDNIQEPGRQNITPRFLSTKRTRRNRTAGVVTGVTLLLVLLIWKTTSNVPNKLRSTYRLPMNIQSPLTPIPIGGKESPLIAPPLDTTQLINNTVPMGLAKSNPAFHLLIPASHSNSNLCKTLLSSFVLGYPAPTLVNYGKTFDGDGWDKGTHAGKIRGTYDFLKNDKNVKDNDLVLIVDGFDVWFQLPPKVLIRRYHKLIEEANERLRRRYGTVVKELPGKQAKRQTIQKYTQKVLFGADKVCWPNDALDPACAAVPYSTLPTDVYGPATDKDPLAFANRPRFLNSGTIIGSAADVRDVYAYAADKVEKDNRGAIGDQFVFAEIFGEQEYMRETIRRDSRSRWLDWLSDVTGTSDSPLSTNETIHNVTLQPPQKWEFGIGLDYESGVFQTMTHSAADIEFIAYGNSTLLSEVQALRPSLRSQPFTLPSDLQQAHPPFWYSSPGNDSDAATERVLLPFNPRLDTLFYEPTWYQTRLATNIFAPSIPALLHFNGDKNLLTDWWPSMWYTPYARALLRRFIRSTQTEQAAYAASTGGLTWWDMRGGRGGVWTDYASWMSWGKVCKGVEDDVFMDGKGTWGKEDGSGKVKNVWGKVMEGDDEDEVEG